MGWRWLTVLAALAAAAACSTSNRGTGAGVLVDAGTSDGGGAGDGGSTVDPNAIWSVNGAYVNGVAVDDSTVYIASFVGLYDTSVTAVDKVSHQTRVVDERQIAVLGGPALGPTDLFYGGSSDAGAALFRLPKSGGSPTLGAVGNGTSITVSVTSTDVFFAHQTGIARVPLDSGSQSLLTSECSAPAAAATPDIVVCAAASHNLLAIKVSDSTSTPIASDPGYIVAMAADSSFVFWLSFDHDTYAMSLHSAPLAGGTAATLWTGGGSVIALSMFRSLVLDADRIYWLEASPSTTDQRALLALSKTGGAPVVLAQTPFDASWLAVDGTDAYFAVYDPTAKVGSVVRAPLH